MNNITESLSEIFTKHRIVFWYDEREEFLETFNELAIENIEKIAVNHQEFKVKYTILKEKPDTKFLLYFNYDTPAYEENWLLDVQLSHKVFRTDKEAMILSEIGLDYKYKDVVKDHQSFFGAKDRRNKLQKLLTDSDTNNDIRKKIVSIIIKSDEVRTEKIVLKMFQHAIEDSVDRYISELQKFNIDKFFWELIEKKYNYKSDTPTMYDFLIEIFKFETILDFPSQSLKDTKLLLSNWKENVAHSSTFIEFSKQIEKDLNLNDKLSNIDIINIVDDDCFELVDKKIIHTLVQMVKNREISNESLSVIIKNRTNKFFYKTKSDIPMFYKTVEHAANVIYLIHEYEKHGLRSSNLDDVFKEYSLTFYKIDFEYRKFIYYYDKSERNNIFTELSSLIENMYSNKWLLDYNNKVTAIIDEKKALTFDESKKQLNFYTNNISSFVEKKNHIYVIISDAFRFECGVELKSRLEAEQRYSVDLDYMVSTLPSYTQFGMAALLPHNELSISDSDTVYIDGIASNSTQNRAKILSQNGSIVSSAMLVSDYLKVDRDEGRRINKEEDVTFLYHNHIDKTGDDKMSESKVFDSVETELETLIKVINKLRNNNAINIYITADHGFLYQDSKIDDSDFSMASYKAENLYKENRRFVIGTNISNDDFSKKFKSENVGLNSGYDIVIPNSINRFRVKGAGSKFVHGGATPQEMVIPLITLKISKDKNRTEYVDISILQSGGRITTTNKLINFYQEDVATDQTLPRQIRAAFYTKDRECISDIFHFNFDKKEELQRSREVKYSFTFSDKAAKEYKNQDVYLLLEEPIVNSNEWKEYRQFTYNLNVSFELDF